jgi:DNA mismatch repair ATPase MutS
MDCMVQCGEGEANAGEQDNHQGEEEVTFLYKLCHGSSPKSYGINVAKLAGLPPYVLNLALAQSKQFERSMQKCDGGNGTSAEQDRRVGFKSFRSFCDSTYLIVRRSTKRGFARCMIDWSPLLTWCRLNYPQIDNRNSAVN